MTLADQVSANKNICFNKHIMLKKHGLIKQQCLDLLETCSKIDEWRKSITGTGLDSDYRSNTQLDLTLNKHFYPELESWDATIYSAFNTAILEYQSVYGVQFVYEDEGYSILKYTENQQYHMHSDSSKSNRRLVSGLIYLNEEFSGGETDFPLQDVRVKPESGLICLFPSIYTHPHASLPVIEGTKFVIVTWFLGF